MIDVFTSRLNAAKNNGSLRTLSFPQGEDLSSNDYLGFAVDKILQQRVIEKLPHYPLGASASRLLRGHLELHETTEHCLADFVKREAALLFPSGYQANVGLLSTVLNPETLVFSDQLNHASLIDGIRLSGAEKIIYPHRDLTFLSDKLKGTEKKNCRKVIVTESLFSMDGTIADLKALAEISQRFGAELIVDEAHSTGVLSESLVAQLNLTEVVLATTHAAGKALGAAGAWVAGSTLLKEYLINFARPFIFSTAPLPALTVHLQEAVKYYQEVGIIRREAVIQRAKKLRAWLSSLLLQSENGPIIPILIGENARAMKMAERLQQKGWDVRAVRPPTVPQGTARLRVTVKWQNSETVLKQFADQIQTEIMNYE